MIPQPFIQSLLDRVDIVDVVGRYVKLKKGGANWMGLCPFHGEKSPSFTVSPTKQFYHCFGCGAHGTAIGFLMEHLGLSYPEAIRDLARELGLEVPDDRGEGEAVRRPDPSLLETLAAAQRFYAARLRDHPQAVDYLKGRGMSGATAARFGIGYAPEGWRSLEAAVPDYSAEPMVATGLVIEAEPDEEGGRRRRYDRFRNRIMFPIRNRRGQVIGFGGRVLGQGEPKYLNSPETPVFSKGRELYGLFEAAEAIRREDCVLVVEGYMDVVMLAQLGVAHAVATLGTATTADHVKLLLRQANRVVFAFDGDAAGRRAAWRALEACLPQVSDTRRIDFLFLPPEHDPDSFVREHGAAGMARALADALPLSEFMLRELSGRIDLATPEGRARLQAEARPLLQQMPPVALRLQLVQAVAARAGVRTEDLERYLGWTQTGDVRASEVKGSGRLRDPAQVDVEAASGPSEPATRSGWRPRWTAPPRPRVPPAARPDLPARVRLLLALHPALAREEWDLAFVPEGVVRWIHQLARMPEGLAFAGVLEAVDAVDPDAAAALRRDLDRDRGVLTGLGTEQARAELEGALMQLKLGEIKTAIDRRAAAGLDGPDERAEYTQLQAALKALTS